MSRRCWRSLALLGLVFQLGLVRAGVAQTPDGVTPAVEASCDGFTGVAHGLCVAFCEAQDCDVQPPDDTSCGRLLEHFRAVTGQDPPCLDTCRSGGSGLVREVSIEINADDEYCVWVDDAFVDCQTNWPVTGTYLVPLSSGCHVLAVQARDVFGLISGMIAVTRVDGSVVSVSGDGSWLVSPI